MCDPHDNTFAVEIVAHTYEYGRNNKGSVEEHFVRCSKYYQAELDCKESWVINFTTRKPTKNTNDAGYKWPLESDKIRAAHIWYDLKWKNAIITIDSDPQNPRHVVLT